jgi:hypothetical protein
MGVRLPFGMVLASDLDFGITNSDSNEVGIFQIDSGNALPLVSHQLDYIPYKVAHSLGIRSVRNYTF